MTTIDSTSPDAATVSGPSRSSRRPTGAVWVTGIVWAVAFAAAQIAIATPAAEALNGLAWLAFAAFSVACGVTVAGWRGFAVFAVIGYVVVLLLEACSVASGFPFGYFRHHMDGPRLFDVPLFVPVAYIVFGWPAWLLARLVTGALTGPLTRLQRVTVPLVATFVLAGWDLHYDAISSTLDGRSSYGSPSGFMGVPLTNFFGWLVTGWVVFQLWALLERRWTRPVHDQRSLGLWVSVAWGALPLETLAGFLVAGDEVVAVGGRQFLASDIWEASFIAGLLTMTLVGLVGAVRAWPLDGRGSTPGAMPDREV